VRSATAHRNVATHRVKAALESWLATDPPGDHVQLVRLETELVRLKAAVRLQVTRIPAGEAAESENFYSGGWTIR
jgi:hypothetical protein